MDGALRRDLSRALASPVETLRAVAGGDINEAWRIGLEDGRTLFAKSRKRAPARFFRCEAQGLAWLAEAGSLRVPAVVAMSDSDEAGTGSAFLVLEWLASGPRRSDFDDVLGRGLARLHLAGAPCFGFREDNYIGSLPQPNRPADTWAEFYRERRIAPQLRAARDAGWLSSATVARCEGLLDRLEERVGDPEPPSRLHGDLWGGNLHSDGTGTPCLIDPAVYGGHREMDLAMMRLFGGVSPRVFEAYAEVSPPCPGATERVALYQLYPLLVHVNLFQGSYAGAFESALARCARGGPTRRPRRRALRSKDQEPSLTAPVSGGSLVSPDSLAEMAGSHAVPGGTSPIPSTSFTVRS